MDWTVSANSTATYVERNNTTCWTRGEGTLVYNGSSDTYTDSGLSYSENYTYQLWGYNITENTFSGNNLSGYNWTAPQPPQNRWPRMRLALTLQKL